MNPRQTVTIDGVQLTREQIERAHAELQQRPKEFEHSQIVTNGSSRFVVPSPGVAICLRALCPMRDGQIRVICVFSPNENFFRPGSAYVLDADLLKVIA